jgi:hypothetical protein
MPHSKHLGLTVNQVQGDVNLINMPDPKHLDLVVSQVQSNDHPPLSYL